jgi:hypothetical protein
MLPMFVFSQPKWEIVHLNGKSSQELYDLARTWFGPGNKYGDQQIQVENPVKQRIISREIKNINYRMHNYPTYVEVYYVITLEFKDQKFRYAIDINTIKYEDGAQISYQDFKLITTKEGWKSYVKNTGIRPIIRKHIAAEGNRNAFALVSENMDGLVADLTSYLKQTKSRSASGSHNF